MIFAVLFCLFMSVLLVTDAFLVNPVGLTGRSTVLSPGPDTVDSKATSKRNKNYRNDLGRVTGLNDKFDNNISGYGDEEERDDSAGYGQEFFPPSNYDSGMILGALPDLVLSCLIGMTVGLSVVLFKDTISHLQSVLYSLPSLPTFFIPILGALAVSALGMLNNPRGFDSITSLDKTLRSPIDPFGALIKALAAVFTLGAGNSLGPEGPVVEIGLAASRLLGPDRGQLLGCGAAAAISAGFNAPLAGVFFALEIVNNDGNDSDGGSVASKNGLTLALIASVIAALVSGAGLKEELAFELMTVAQRADTNIFFEFPSYVGLGLLSGATASAFKAFTKNLKRRGETINANVKPLIGGCVVSIISIFFPQVLFFGYDNVNSMVSEGGTVDTAMLCQIFVAKILATSACLSSGLVGGLFAPSLFIGSTLGGIYHNILELVTSNPIFLAATSVYSYEGASSLLASLFKAPLTSTILLFELTKNYDMILPSLACAGVASVTAEFLEKEINE